MIRMYNNLLIKVFRFQKTILSFGEPGFVGKKHPHNQVPD